jgi:hypothetical protein
MNYDYILRRALDISWKHKILWIFGFFTAIFELLGIFDKEVTDKELYGLGDWSVDFMDVVDRYFSDIFSFIPEPVRDWLASMHPVIIVALIMTFLALLLFFFVAKFISSAGLVVGVIKADKNEKVKFSELVKSAAFYFWRFLGLFFISFFVIFTFVVLIVIFIAMSFILLEIFGFFLLIFLIPMLFAGILFFGNIYQLAQREIVYKNAQLFDSIGKGYHLFVTNFIPNLIIFLIDLLLYMISVIMAIIIVAIAGLIMAVIGWHSVTYFIIALAVTFPIFVVMAILIEGFLGTFFSALFTIFYLELQKPALSDTTAIPGTAN